MLDALIINYEYDPRFDSGDALLDYLVIATGWAEGIREAGANVTHFQRFSRDQVIWRNGVCYRMFVDRYPPRLRWRHVPRRLHAAVDVQCREALSAGRSAVVHMGGLVFPWQTRHLRRTVPPECGFAVQHHAELPRSGIRGYVQARGLRGMDAFLFATRELATQWIERRIIPSPELVYEVMECSSAFRYLDRRSARAITGMSGDPIVLWTGNLTPNKDPLTVLAGFEQVLGRMPAARLYMAYREANLLDQVRAKIAGIPRLRQAVTLLGTVAHSEISVFYNSADLFVQGSSKEGSGLAVLDALTCGVVPVVTDIPSFRTLLDGGAIGALWPVGDAEALADAMLRVLEAPLAEQSSAARAHFENRWSYPAIGRRSVEVYRQILQRRTAGADSSGVPC